MTRIILITLLLLSSVVSAADWFLKNDNPDEIGFVRLVSGDCPISESRIDDIIEAEIIRSRIKPVDGWVPDSIALHVQIYCIKLSVDNRHFFYVSFKLAQFTKPDENAMPLITTVLYQEYGAHGAGRLEDFERSIREATEKSMTDYLKANAVD